MIILGIDPAIRTTGYGVLRFDALCRPEILDCGVITNTQKMPHSECVHRLYGGIQELVAAFSPDAASLEDPFVGRNAKTAIILGMARGAILAALANNGVPAYSYAPSVAKRAAVGRGGATKEQIAIMLAAELHIEIERIPLDSSDALALALCHAQRVMSNIPGKLGKAL